uniref:Uncharacterized protein n=1 Tax=uncultured prokaryote TaxID=198431 RepID=A0A0H5QLU8_9ZZZZ|nr:hypothetical protein [uncultured prokaryote]
MLKIDLYPYGSGYRVRVHQHPGPADERCTSDCYHYAPERAYGRKGDKPSETRALVTAACVRALNQRETGHVQFLNDLGEQIALDLDI